MKLVFLGTPAFAVPTLQRLVEAGHDVRAVFTQPDRPKGRGQKDAMPPVKECALRLGLSVRQPERIRRPEAVAELTAFGVEAMVVVGYGQILPQSILDLAPILNVHASLLPKYRGAAPIQWSIANGEAETGVTIMKIDAGLDTGDMLRKRSTPIGEQENAVELGARLATMGADLLIETLLELDRTVPEPQDPTAATLAPILKKEDGHIDWSRSSREIYNRVRGFLPWPGGYGFLRGSRFNIWRAAVSEASLAPGVLRNERGRLLAGCGEGALELLEVQLEGKKRLDARTFLNGFALQEEERLA